MHSDLLTRLFAFPLLYTGLHGTEDHLPIPGSVMESYQNLAHFSKGYIIIEKLHVKL